MSDTHKNLKTYSVLNSSNFSTVDTAIKSSQLPAESIPGHLAFLLEEGTGPECVSVHITHDNTCVGVRVTHVTCVT